MVELKVVDGKIVFAKWKIETHVPQPTIPTEPHGETEHTKFTAAFGMHQIEAYGFLAYSDQEKDEIVKKLTEKGFAFNVVDVSPSPEEATRASEVDGKVKSRTEALDYIVGKK
jgi:hypothetical protein